MPRELSYKQLKLFCNPELLNFKTTADLDNTEILSEHEKAIKTLTFGLGIKRKGFNIFAFGASGIDKTNIIKKAVHAVADKEKIPPDLCYVYNFEEPKKPKKIVLPAGQGNEFKKDMKVFIDCLTISLPKVFGGDALTSKKIEETRNYQENRQMIVDQIKEQAEKSGFSVKFKSSGVYFSPAIDGEMMSEEQFDSLPEEEKRIINRNSLIMQQRTAEVSRILKESEENLREKLKILEETEGLTEINRNISPLLKKYSSNKEVIKYLMDVKENILANIDRFFMPEPDGQEVSESDFVASVKNRSHSRELAKYEVNVLVDNSTTTSAPVIFEYNPSRSSLYGELEYENQFGTLVTDFTKIRAGALHKANGGYLILQAENIFKETSTWELLQRFFTSGEVPIGMSRDNNTGYAISGPSPEAFNVDVKVIVIGDTKYYNALSDLDFDFTQEFKVMVDFDYEVPVSDSHIKETIQALKDFIADEKIRELDVSAVNKVLEHSSRLAGSQRKLTTRHGLLNGILIKANALAEHNNSENITGDHITEAIKETEQQSSMYEDKLDEMIDNGRISVMTDGAVVGQINGLAVIVSDSYSFGKPTKITATTYVGKTGIVNIEKEADMSGSIHVKGVEVLTGYIGQTYAQEFPLALSCKICFEQNYEGIDGDSASSSELFAVLSSLSGVPINQGIAVTGSIDQRGMIQSVGGVTLKIEGFFDLCEKRGLTGKQGVIIPEVDAKDLTLNDKVVEAVKTGQFHIYPIKHIDEGIEILMGMPAGERDLKGEYPVDSVNGLVLYKLRRFFECSVPNK